jgi:hypothetical protein
MARYKTTHSVNALELLEDHEHDTDHCSLDDLGSEHVDPCYRLEFDLIG